MKSLLLTFALFLTSLNSLDATADTANYFRFWQGFKKFELSKTEFLVGLQPFMQLTIDTYGGKGLTNYVVAVPPAGKPAYVPEEFALVAFNSEESYKAVRTTPEGKAYGEAHWEIFDKNISKSAEMRILPTDLKEIDWNIAYNVLGRGIPLNNSYVTFFLGTRKPGVSTSTFRARMLEHFRFVAKSFEPKGLVGYLALSQRNYEVAYVIWDSKASADKAFASDEGRAVLKDTATILVPLMFTEAQLFTGEVANQSAYKALE